MDTPKSGIIANSGKVGEFVGDLLGRLAGVAAGDSGKASKRCSAGWVSVPERDADAKDSGGSNLGR